VLIAQYRNDQYKSDRVDGSLHEAMGLLTRLLQAAEEGRCTDASSSSWCARSRGARRATSPLVSLQRALTLAEPAGYVRLYVDERRVADGSTIG
jgi:LuxR family maltose regulon positive regulatory protein